MSGEWEECTLGAVLAELKNGLNCKQDKTGQGDRISRIESVSDGTFDDARVGFATLTDTEKRRYRLKGGDILFSHINSPPHVGKVAFFESDTPVFHGVNLLLVRPFEKVEPKFLFYFLVSLRASGYWEKNCKKSVNQASVNQKDIAKVAFRYPRSLEEQQRIVAVLDEAFAAIATATANAEKNLANARELFDDFLSATFDGTTNDWDVSTIGEVCKLRSGTTVKAELEQPSGEVPYLKVADMSHPDNLDGVTTSSRFLRRSDVGRNALIPAGATIFPKRGGAIMTNKKRLVATPMAADLNIMSVIPGPRLAARFLNYYFQNVDMRLLGSGSSIPQINNYDIEPLKIAIPDEAAQLAFVAQADALKFEIMKLTEVYSRKLVQLSQLKQSLLQCAFAGELTAAMPETIAA